MTLLECYAEELRDRPVILLYKPENRRVHLVPISDEIPPEYLSEPLSRKLDKELPSLPTRAFAAHFAKLDALSRERGASDGCEEQPSTLALTRAREVLEQFENEGLEPTRIILSIEGGVAICFVNGDKYADIESLNSGGILGAISNRRDPPIVWEVDPSASGFARAAARIREFLDGTSRAHAAERQAR